MFICIALPLIYLDSSRTIFLARFPTHEIPLTSVSIRYGIKSHTDLSLQVPVACFCPSSLKSHHAPQNSCARDTSGVCCTHPLLGPFPLSALYQLHDQPHHIPLGFISYCDLGNHKLSESTVHQSKTIP